jgi:hypothetical protein
MNEQLNDDQGGDAGVFAGQPILPSEFKVSLDSLRKGREYGVLELDTANATDMQDLAPLKLWSSERQGKQQLLGLSWTGDRFVLSHFVGAVWLDEEQESVQLVVRSKLSTDALAADPVAMYIEACRVSETSSGLFGCEPEQSVIRGIELPQTTLLQVAVFLSALVDFVRKHLRHGFVGIRANLVGKVKGKILTFPCLCQQCQPGGGTV